MSEASSDDEFPRPAFPIQISTNVPPPENGPPVTAEQYLSLVRQESSDLPNVLVSRLNPLPESSPPKSTTRLQKRLRLPSTPSYLLPDVQWKRSLAFSFAKLQQAMERAKLQTTVAEPSIPARGDLQHWRTIIFGKGAQGPALHFALALDHVRVVEALRVVDTELLVEELDTDAEDAKSKPFAALTELGRGACCDWIFVLMALLSLPLSGESASILRSILQKAIIARLAYVGPENEEADKRMIRLKTDERLARINVLITLMEDNFAQGDLPFTS